MKFEFDTRTDTAKDAAALAAALAVLHGDEVAKVLDAAATRIEVGDVVVRAPDGLNVDAIISKVAGETNVPASRIDPRQAPEGTEEDRQTFSRLGADTGPSATTVTQEEVEGIDAFGIPWDARIHSSTKGMNKDGSWSRRRNTPDATFDAVMAELMGNKSQGEPNAAEAFGNPTPSEASAPPATDGSGETDSTVGQTATTVASPSSPVPPPPPVPTASSEAITFPKLMVKITKAQTAQTIDAATVLGFLAEYKLSAVKELASAPAETIQAVNDLVDAYVGG